MNIEFENNSAPGLEQYIKDRDIKCVIFDVDNTLLETEEYFDDAILCIGMDIAEHFQDSRPSELITNEINEILSRMFVESGYKPRLLNESCLEALEEYLDGEVNEEYKKILDEHLENFYLESPEPYESTKRILKLLVDLGMDIGLHSHAGKVWTHTKTEMLKELVSIDNLPYLATDINGDKDEKAWLDSFDMYDHPVENILVVGDSLTSDIIPAIKAGAKHLVWIDRYGKGLPEELKELEDVEITVIRELSQLENI